MAGDMEEGKGGEEASLFLLMSLQCADDQTVPDRRLAFWAVFLKAFPLKMRGEVLNAFMEI